ncbi:MAG: sulfur reduction protein DsrE [Deltaproteobacteria bacterium]|nr:MAG: sulfur reduction protein DsrE [Deltaproteobacteria bacterium]
MIEKYDYVGTLFDNESNANKVTVAFTMANKALAAGHSSALMLMVDAVHLACPGRVDGIDIGEPFMPVKPLMESFLEKGGELLVCDACLAHNKIDPDSIDPRCKKINADDVVFLLMNAKGTLQTT